MGFVDEPILLNQAQQFGWAINILRDERKYDASDDAFEGIFDRLTQLNCNCNFGFVVIFVSSFLATNIKYIAGQFENKPNSNIHLHHITGQLFC